MTADLDALRRRAGELGVEPSYVDVEGVRHDASASTLRAVVEVLEDDRAADASGVSRRLEPVVVARGGDVVDVAGGRAARVVLADGAEITLPVAGGRATVPPDVPVGCHALRVDGAAGNDVATIVVPPAAMPRERALDGGSALFAPTYALWERDDPLPSFEQLAALATLAGRAGVDVVATLPLYAAFLDGERYDPSPYAPASRLHWNEAYLSDSGLPPSPPVAVDSLLDWSALGARRRSQLLAAAADLDAETCAGVAAFTAERPDVADYAAFRAGLDARSGHPPATVRRSHELAQYLAHHQLAAVEGPGRAKLALDLPIGGHSEGYETWAHPELFAAGMSVGAPPDELFAGGQNWGFPPQLPGAGRRGGHELWRRVVARAGEHASLLRVDHVMGVHRLWWIPTGAAATDGVYVRYPRHELLAVIAAEAASTATTIIGEDLGTVPAAVRAAMGVWDALGLYEEQFHLDGRRLGVVPARSVAGMRTHDMPAFATAFAAAAAAGPGGLAGYRHLLAAAVGHDVDASADAVLDAALARLGRSRAYLVVADLDDLRGETAPHNVPGTVLATTWRRRLPAPTSEVLADPDVQRRLRLLATRREDHR